MHTHRFRDYFEVASAFQKSIRRCLLDDAVGYGLELYRSGSTINDYFVFKNVWNRLIIISIEDIGPANPLAICYVIKSYREAVSVVNLDGKKRNLAASELVLVNAISYLVTSKKTRVNDWASLIVYSHENFSLEIVVEELSFALETNNTHQALVALDKLFKSGSSANLKNFSKSPVHSLIWNCFDKLSINDSVETYQKYLDVLKFAEIACYSHRFDKSYLIFIHLIHILKLFKNDWSKLNLDQLNHIFISSYDQLSNEIDKELPDYAYDKHTETGRKMGRGFRHFIEEGSVLTNIDSGWSNLSDQYLEIVKSQRM